LIISYNIQDSGRPAYFLHTHSKNTISNFDILDIGCKAGHNDGNIYEARMESSSLNPLSLESWHFGASQPGGKVNSLHRSKGEHP
jgi:hypothetical protein